jgi:hypothetical protein
MRTASLHKLVAAATARWEIKAMESIRQERCWVALPYKPALAYLTAALGARPGWVIQSYPKSMQPFGAAHFGQQGKRMRRPKRRRWAATRNTTATVSTRHASIIPSAWNAHSLALHAAAWVLLEHETHRPALPLQPLPLFSPSSTKNWQLLCQRIHMQLPAAVMVVAPKSTSSEVGHRRACASSHGTALRAIQHLWQPLIKVLLRTVLTRPPHGWWTVCIGACGCAPSPPPPPGAM